MLKEPQVLKGILELKGLKERLRELKELKGFKGILVLKVLKVRIPELKA